MEKNKAAQGNKLVSSAGTKFDIPQMAKFLASLENVMLVTHISPDVDGLGSLLALARALEKQGAKKIIRFAEENVPEDLPFLIDIKKVETELKLDEVESVVALDCGEIKRTGLEKELRNFSGQVINIDHHPQPKPFGDFYFADSKKTSTAEIVYLLIREMDVKIDKEMADMLLAGLVCDTQSFQVSGTSASSLEVAAELMRHGARMPLIAKNLFRVKPLTALKLWGRVLDRMNIDSQTKMAYSVVKKSDCEELNVTSRELEGLVDLINSVSEAKFSLLLTESGDNVVKGSLRSESFKKTDVSKIAELFGGGGHRFASGFKVDGQLKQNNGKWVVVKNNN